MRITLLLVLLIHGLLHLIGFAKAFNLYHARQFVQPISKLSGMLWLLAFLFCLIAALLIAFKNNYWWVLGFAAVVLSQILIIYVWQDAKFGTLANVVILLAAVIGYGNWSYYKKYATDVANALQQKSYFNNSMLTETDIAHLPEPVKKYIRYTGCIGKPKVNNFRIQFQGKIRKDEQSEWMPFSSEQYNFMNAPTRLFFMNAVMKKMPVAGYHAFHNGNAFMDIRLLSLFKVQYEDGSNMNTAETVTFFNDMCCMAPATLIDKRISWELTDSNTVKAQFTSNGITIAAHLFFNTAGELVNFTSSDRYNTDAGKKLPWSTPLKNYRRINGYKLAGYAETIYTFPDKAFCYGVFETQNVQYNYHKMQ